jgi:flavin-dependent dehydrogenase
MLDDQMTKFDVVVVGAGPAGSVAALVLARAGARVTMIDRATFPRDKLCGDSVNPGALGVLERLGIASEVTRAGLAVGGMRVTGAGAVVIDGRYPDGVRGVSIRRRDLDWILINAAIQAGVRFEPGVAVREAVVDDARGGPRVCGVRAGSNGSAHDWRAPVVIGAEGRRSTLAFACGLARHPRTPRRWAIGAYFAGVAGMAPLGEMHVRAGRYIGVASVPGSLTNVCLVKPSGGADATLRDPRALLLRELEADELLRDRFGDARLVTEPAVLGPLAVEPTGRTIDGLLLAGDAAGFIDPMTGDGLRFAMRGGELAAAAALDALAHGWGGVHQRLAAARRREFAGKMRFNRTLRSLVTSPAGVRLAARAAQVAPGVLRAAIAHAGDCHVSGT